MSICLWARQRSVVQYILVRSLEKERFLIVYSLRHTFIVGLIRFCVNHKPCSERMYEKYRIELLCIKITEAMARKLVVLQKLFKDRALLSRLT